MSYILDALKKDPISQQQLHIDPLRKYHQGNTSKPVLQSRYLYVLLAIIVFVISYLTYGGGHWLAQTFADNEQHQSGIEEPLRASRQISHPLADYFVHGQVYNQQLVDLRAEQRKSNLKAMQEQAAAKQQVAQQQQSELIAVQLDAALAKRQIDVQTDTDKVNTNRSKATSSEKVSDAGTKPRIELTANEQDKISPELLAAFNRAIDEAYTEDDTATQPILSTTTKSSSGKPGQQTEVPLLAQLPSRYRNSIPAIQFSLHMYSSDLSSRWVRMNGQDYFEGGESPDGVGIEEIRPQFVVLSYRGKSFRLPALSSW